MNDDLISRKALMQCYEGGNGFDNKASYESIRKMIEYQPTAYDVDAVCKEMNRIGKIYCNSVKCECECENCDHFVMMNTLTNIVRNGGKKE